MISRPCDPEVSCGISVSLETLSPARGQIAHVLLTRSPLYSGTEAPFRVRLACLIHAASVRSEPGSNSPLSKNLSDERRTNPSLGHVLIYGATRVRKESRLGGTSTGHEQVCAIPFSKIEGAIAPRKGSVLSHTPPNHVKRESPYFKRASRSVRDAKSDQDEYPGRGIGRRYRRTSSPNPKPQFVLQSRAPGPI